jgi:tellurite resistance protein TehA-like permease
VLSSLITGYYVWHQTMPFNLGWWGLTFPLGVYAAGTDLLYHAFGTAIFSWAAQGFFALLATFWVVVATLTIRHLAQLAHILPASHRGSLSVDAAEEDAS